MTRFARAKGSKASNERVPEEATPWGEMKQQLVAKNQHAQEAKKKHEADKRREKNYKAFLETVEEEKSKNSKWAEFPIPTDKPKKKKKKIEDNNNESKDKAPKKKKKIETVPDNNDSAKIKNKKIKNQSESKSKNQNLEKNTTQSEAKPIEISAEKPLKNAEKKPTKRKLNSNPSIAPPNKKKKPEENLTKNEKKKQKMKNQINNNSGSRPKIQKLEKNTIQSEAKPTEISAEKTSKNAVKKRPIKRKSNNNPSTAPPNKKKKFEELSEEDLKKIEKKKQKKLRQIGKRKQFVTLHSKKDNKLNKPHKRRKDLVEKMFINGKEVEISYVDGFPVKKEDAERLRQLRKEMISKGLPRSEIKIALKLERRKAEKAFAREKKKVCFNCRKSGHNLSECPELGKEQLAESAGTGICFKCGSTEHTHFECKVVRGQEFKFAQCFICHEQGHIARQCPDNARGLYPKGGACKVCGDVTHLKKDCPKYQAQQRQLEQSVHLETIGSGDNPDNLTNDPDSVKIDLPKRVNKIIKF